MLGRDRRASPRRRARATAKRSSYARVPDRRRNPAGPRRGVLALYKQRDDPRRRVPPRPERRAGAAHLRHVERLPLEEDGRLAVRARLRRRAEERRAERRRRRARRARTSSRSGRKDIPKIFQFRTVAENDSLYNTPPTFAIYLIRNVLALGRRARAGSTPSRSATARRRSSSTTRSTRTPDSTGCPSRRRAAA